MLRLSICQIVNENVKNYRIGKNCQIVDNFLIGRIWKIVKNCQIEENCQIGEIFQFGETRSNLWKC